MFCSVFLSGSVKTILWVKRSFGVILAIFNHFCKTENARLIHKISINPRRKSGHCVALSIISTTWRFLSLSRNISFISQNYGRSLSVDKMLKLRKIGKVSRLFLAIFLKFYKIEQAALRLVPFRRE